MPISFQDAYTKFQAIGGSNNTTDLTQAKQDINIGYKRFDAALNRYFTRKQQFANLVASQRYYQVPVDSIRVIGVSVVVSSGYEVPLTQVRSESDWRTMNIFTNYTTNNPTHYFIYGNDQVGIFPAPSAAVTNGLRFVYQPQDVDLTQDDYSTGTASITNGLVAVTGSGTVWTSAMIGRLFQVTDGTDGNWYEVTAVAGNTALTLKTPYVGTSVSGGTYKIAQVFIFPSEYDDVPVDYALSRFYESRDDSVRAKYHSKKYKESMADAIAKYASSSTSQVITGEDLVYPANMWLWPPMVG